MNTYVLDDANAQPRYQLDRLELLAICLIAFVIPAFNGRPYTLSSGFFCFLASIVLLLHSARKTTKTKLSKSTLRIMILLLSWTLIATLSTAANFNLDAVENLFGGYIIPLLLYISLTKLRFGQSDFDWFLRLFSLGILFRFGYGALVYYAEWGIPTISEMLFARYDLIRMSTYMSATFGSTGNSASLLAIMFVFVALVLTAIHLEKITRVLLLIGLLLIIINILITGSRSAIIISLALFLSSLLILKIKAKYIVLFGLFIFMYFLYENIGDDNIDYFYSAASVDSQGDNSVAERFESISYGFNMMLENPFGVGPGMSYLYNPHSVPHQFAIAQGSDLGILGLFITLIISLYLIVDILRRFFDKKVGKISISMVSLYGAVSWMFYAMWVNIPVSAGVTMPWIGLFVVFLAFSNQLVDERIIH